MRVVCWNLSFGSRRDEAGHDRAWRFLLDDLHPDLALLQQARPPAWARGSIPCLAPEPDDPWASAIATTFSADQISPDDEDVLARLGGSIACARVTLQDGESLLAASVYTKAAPVSARDLRGVDADTIRRPGQDEAWYNDLAYAALRELTSGASFIVGGDWQTGRLLDERQERHSGAGREFFARAERDGWVECLRRFHDEEQRTLFRGDVPYQLDHVFCDHALAGRLKSCDVVPEPATALGLSDRAPIVMELDL